MFLSGKLIFLHEISDRNFSKVSIALRLKVKWSFPYIPRICIALILQHTTFITFQKPPSIGKYNHGKSYYLMYDWFPYFTFNKKRFRY